MARTPKLFTAETCDSFVPYSLARKMGWPDHVRQGCVYTLAPSKVAAAATFTTCLGAGYGVRSIRAARFGESSPLLPFLRPGAVLVYQHSGVRDTAVFVVDAAEVTRVGVWRMDETQRRLVFVPEVS